MTSRAFSGPWENMGICRLIRQRLAGSCLASLNPYRLASAPFRGLPDFLVIGTQRGGTTSLYNALIQHPLVRGSSHKEVHYFDLNHAKGPMWYQSHFPLMCGRPRGATLVTGEASPYYLFHPCAAERVQELLPNVKLIALLRNPVDRAISHYHYMVRLGREPLTLDDAVAREPYRLAGEADRIRADPHYHSMNHRRYSYLSRGLYLNQILDWTKHFSRHQLLVLDSETFFQKPGTGLNKVFAFLELDAFDRVQWHRDNRGHYPETAQSTRRKLQGFFEEPNFALYDYLDVDYGWGA